VILLERLAACRIYPVVERRRAEKGACGPVTKFQAASAVLVRDVTPVDREDADIVRVLRVFWTESDAVHEVRRLRAADESEDRLNYCEATEVAT
jgi:hypothetical protein